MIKNSINSYSPSSSLFFISLLFILLVSSSVYSQSIRYVKPIATGTGDGSSWVNASADLQAMINSSDINDQVWVASGTYKPNRPIDNQDNISEPNNRHNAFMLKDSVKVYGGFPALGSPVWEDRNWEVNVTVLSGDIGTSGNNADNAYHVVVTLGLYQEPLSAATILDGFTITGGNANGATYNDEHIVGYHAVSRGSGGGIFIINASVTFNNLIVTGNNATNGGGIANHSHANLVTFNNTSITFNNATAEGGGMYFYSYSVTALNDMEITQNTANMGGGVYDFHSIDMFLNNVLIDGNSAISNGGGIYNNVIHTTEFTNVTVSNNDAVNGGGLYNYYGGTGSFSGLTITGNTASLDGGGMYNDNVSGMVFSDLIISNNTATNGAGVYNTAIVSYTDVVISGNAATGNGGGFYNKQGIPLLNRIQIKGNSANRGGGIYYVSSDSEPGYRSIIRNLLLSGNKALSDGGGIYNNNSKIVIINATIAGNNAVNGGGIFNNSASWCKVTNTALTGNSSGIVNGTVPAECSYSLVQGLNDPANHNLVSNTDPLFESPVSFTQAPTSSGNYMPKLASPIINKGDTSAYGYNPDENFNPLDLALNPRVYNIDHINYGFVGAIIDIGAYEHAIYVGTDGILYVKEGATGNGTSWEDASGDLQAMMDAPNVKQVWVATGTYKPIRELFATSNVSYNSRENSFTMVDSVKVYGGFPALGSPVWEDRNWRTNITTLSGDIGIEGDDSDNAFHVIVASGINFTSPYLTSETELNGFVVTRGNANGAPNQILHHVDPTNGGGIVSKYSNTKFLNIKVLNNTALYNGGGIYNLNSLSTFENTVIAGNSAVIGGGVCNYAQSSPILKNVNIVGNHGGGFYNYPGSTGKIINATISGNSDMGITYQLSSSKPQIYNCIVVGNQYGQSSDIVGFNSLLQGLAANPANGNISGTIDPLFINAPSYSTAPFVNGDYSLQSGSPVIDMGSNSFYSNNGGSLTDDLDIAGNMRVSNYINEGIIDMGAYEYQVVCATPVPVALPLILCGDLTVANLIAEGEVLRWYATESGGVPLNMTDVLFTDTYYVTQTLNGCEGPRLGVEVTIHELPVSPEGPSQQQLGIDIPMDGTVADIQAEGENIQYYASEQDIVNGNPLLMNTSLIAGNTYYVTQTLGICESPALVVTITSIMGVDDAYFTDLNYYPNPVETYLQIANRNLIDSITVYTLQGQMVIEENLGMAEGKIDFSELNEGSYIVRIVSANAIKNVVILKVKS